MPIGKGGLHVARKKELEIEPESELESELKHELEKTMLTFGVLLLRQCWLFDSSF
jgi:hypothetical protein